MDKAAFTVMIIAGFIVTFWTLAATYQPLENSAEALKTELSGAITEVLGIADDRGNLVAELSETPASGVALYAGGYHHLFWKGVTVSLNQRTVNISSYPNTTLREWCGSDCIDYYAMDEGSGTSTQGYVTGLNGAFAGSPYWVSGRFGKAGIYFGDSVDSWIQVPNHANFQSPKDGITIAFWAKTPDWVNKMGYYAYYFNDTEWKGWETRLQSYNTSAWFFWRLVTAGENPVTGSGMWVYRDEGEPVEVLQAKTHLHDGKWHHIALVYNSTPGKDFGKWVYVDGQRWWGRMPNNDFLTVYDYPYTVGYPWGMLNNQSPFPWGCEVEANDSTIPYCEWYSSYDGAQGVIKAITDSNSDRLLLAIPRWEYKPRIGGPQHVTLAARIKILSVDAAAGGGVVLRNQWWVSSTSVAAVVRDPTIYNYTTPDWITISYDFTSMTNDTIKTDPVVEIRGPVTVLVDWVNEWNTDPANRTIKMPDNMNYLFIGNDYNGGDMRFNTTIDELLIINRTLTKSEVNELYHTPTTWNRSVTAQYNKATIAANIADLPELAVLLLVLGIVIGLILAAARINE